MRILVTGAAGFIGMHTAERLLARNEEVIGIDNLNDYYSPLLKRDRLARLTFHKNFKFYEADITDKKSIEEVFAGDPFDAVIHLAAQAGVRYSLTNPSAYIHSNLEGFGVILEACRQHQAKHFVFASTSSVYGTNAQLPFSEHHTADHPISLYAATKRSNELMAHSYAHLFQLPATGLRFFTVYGPWGRPDMAAFLFAKAIMAGEPIQVFNQGKIARDFTYVDDIVEAVIRVADQPAQPDPLFDRFHPDSATSDAPWRIYNIGNHQPVVLDSFITELERCLGKTAIRHLMPMQAGDVESTFADVSDLGVAVDFAPRTPLASGIERFAKWYLNYYSNQSSSDADQRH
jgi:UDP-glucuronate 4-epimerase